MDLNRLRFLMDLQEQLDVLEISLGKEHPDVISAKEKFYILAGKEFENSVIRMVHEQAVEPVIFKQAQEFYNSLKIYPLLSAEAQKHLFNDFVQMEHQKRRDDFERFCVAVYQQLEYVINELYDNSIVFEKFRGERKQKYYSYLKYDDDTKEYKSHRKGTFTLESQVLSIYNAKAGRFNDEADYDYYWGKSPTKHSLKITQKFKIIVYYFYFSEEVLNDEKYKSITDTFEEIKLMRNKVHRGTYSSDKQKGIIENVITSKYVYYLKFHGFLMDFMNQISLTKNLSLLVGK